MHKKAKESLAYGKKYRRYYERKVARDMCGLQNPPYLEFGEDDAAWTAPVPNSKKRVIHIGLGGVAAYPDQSPMFETEADWHCQIRYLIGHEEGHNEYTTDRAWTMVQENSFRHFVLYAAEQLTGSKPRLVKHEDYKKMLEYLEAQYQYACNVRMLQSFIHFVANSIEDGRIERRKAAKNPGFKQDQRFCRAQTWIHSPITEPIDVTDARMRLITDLNQILSLATTGLWQKGYMQFVAGTVCEQDVRQVLPDIEFGATTRSCAKGMAAAQRIIEAMFPLFFEACRKTDFEQAFEEFLKQVLAALPDLGDKSQYSADEKGDAEAEQEGSNGAQLGDNSLESPITFNIFKEADEDEEQNGTGNGGTGGGQESDQNGSGSSSGSANESDGNQDGKDQSQNGSGKENAGEEKESGSQNGSNSSKKNSSNQPSQNERVGGAAGSNYGSGSGAEAKIMDTLKESQDRNEDAAKEAEAASAADERRQEAERKEPSATDDSLTSDTVDISEIVDENDFHEEIFDRNLAEELPVVIEDQCRIARNMYEEYFKGRRKPVKRHQRTGKLDTHALVRAAMHDIDLFKQPGEDDSFSGCIDVLIDRSGSMCGFKIGEAMEFGARLEQIFKGLVPLKISTFNGGYGIETVIIKNWNDDIPKNACWGYRIHGDVGGGTPTEEMLQIAQKELEARSEKHKLLILLTDECGNHEIQKIIRDIRKDGITFCACYIEEGISDASKEAFLDMCDNRDAFAVEPDKLTESLLPVVKHFTQQ